MFYLSGGCQRFRHPPGLIVNPGCLGAPLLRPLLDCTTLLSSQLRFRRRHRRYSFGSYVARPTRAARDGGGGGG
eukprot:COSAG01_NODE_28728_length_654_cov_0.967568_1_plen_73_part_10